MIEKTARPVVIWLVAVGFCIYATIALGGITRLTGSGLSIVDWNPLMGAIPPLSTQDWTALFTKYQSSPQYQIENVGMSLDAFQQIFLWEYFHRLFARLIGTVFLIPYIYFLIKKRFSKKMALKLAGIFLLGGLQGALGWFMVKSGLVNEPRVSHLRLTAHLSLALFILSYVTWLICEIAVNAPHPVFDHTPPQRGEGRVRGFTVFLTALLAIQIFYGAFTAGLRAGQIFNTFPKMDTRWIPEGLWAFTPRWLNLFSNPITVQFIHRILGTLFLMGVILLWRIFRKNPTPQIQNTVRLVCALVLLQFTLGVFTLLHHVPVVLASLHQLTATALLIGFVRLNFYLKTFRV